MRSAAHPASTARCTRVLVSATRALRASGGQAAYVAAGVFVRRASCGAAHLRVAARMSVWSYSRKVLGRQFIDLIDGTDRYNVTTWAECHAQESSLDTCRMKQLEGVWWRLSPTKFLLPVNGTSSSVFPCNASLQRKPISSKAQMVNGVLVELATQSPPSIGSHNQ